MTEEEAWSQHREDLVQIQANKNEGMPDTGGPLNYEEINRREYSKYTEKKILCTRTASWYGARVFQCAFRVQRLSPSTTGLFIDP